MAGVAPTRATAGTLQAAPWINPRRPIDEVVSVFNVSLPCVTDLSPSTAGTAPGHEFDPTVSASSARHHPAVSDAPWPACHVVLFGGSAALGAMGRERAGTIGTMPRRLRIVALGTALDLLFARPAPETFINSVAGAWSRCIDGGGRSNGIYRTQDRAALAVAAPADDSDEALRAALQRLSQDVTRHLIAAQTGRLLMFHAGAVCHPESGASVVFVAPSGTGKTTLSRLLGHTHGYLTDETVGIDPATGRIHPYPKPLSIARGHRWRKDETSPDVLGLLPAHLSPRVSRIVLLSRDSGSVVSPRAEELATLDAVAALVPETSALNRLPQSLHAVAELLDRAGPLVRLTYGEAVDLAPIVSGFLEDAA